MKNVVIVDRQQIATLLDEHDGQRCHHTFESYEKDPKDHFGNAVRKL